jgi:ubiquinone/menaquinone biosynthesis C-methylase UbiE
VSITPIDFIGIILILLAVISVTWRFACKKWVVPWPSWLAWMLENPYMQVISNSQGIVKKLPLTEGMTIADIGCGAGRISVPVAKIIGPNGHVDGFDIQQKMLNKLSKRSIKNNLSNISSIQTEIKHGILKENQYDLIILVTVLGELPDQKQAIKEFVRGLKSGGSLSITEVIPDPCYQTKNAVEKICTENGLKPLKIYKSLLAYTYNFVKP